MRAHSVSTLSTGATLSFSLCVCRGASVTGAVPPPDLRAGVGGGGYMHTRWSGPGRRCSGRGLATVSQLRGQEWAVGL